MIRRVLLVLLLGAGAAIGETAPTPEPPECNSCTARHKAMQRLQATLPPFLPPATDAPDAAGSSAPVVALTTEDTQPSD